MRAATFLMIGLLVWASRPAASELSVRGELGTKLVLESAGMQLTDPGPDLNLSGSLCWSPQERGKVRPILDAGFLQSENDIGCNLECGTFRIRTTAVPVGAGVRLHVGDSERHRRSIYLEASPVLVYVHQSIVQSGNLWGEDFKGTEDHWLAGGLGAAIVPIALSSAVTLEFGVTYFWTEKLSKPPGDGFFQDDLKGFSKLSLLLGLAVR